MKYILKFSACALFLLAGLWLAGCSSPSNEPAFTDNPKMLPVAGAPAPATPAAPQDELSAARFGIGETVFVDFTTGTDAQAGQIPTHEESIKEDGSITLPLIGSVQAAGKTPGELQNDIHDLYVPKYYVRLTVTVRSENRVYYVGGEISHPGAEVYIGETTVTKAIQAASDFTPFSNHKVWLIHPNGKRVRVNVDKALKDSKLDLPVYPGDQIQVPRRIF